MLLLSFYHFIPGGWRKQTGQLKPKGTTEGTGEERIRTAPDPRGKMQHMMQKSAGMKTNRTQEDRKGLKSEQEKD